MFDFKGSFWIISDMILQLGVLEFRNIPEDEVHSFI